MPWYIQLLLVCVPGIFLVNWIERKLKERAEQYEFEESRLGRLNTGPAQEDILEIVGSLQSGSDYEDAVDKSARLFEETLSKRQAYGTQLLEEIPESLRPVKKTTDTVPGLENLNWDDHGPNTVEIDDLYYHRVTGYGQFYLPGLMPLYDAQELRTDEIADSAKKSGKSVGHYRVPFVGKVTKHDIEFREQVAKFGQYEPGSSDWFWQIDNKVRYDLSDQVHEARVNRLHREEVDELNQRINGLIDDYNRLVGQYNRLNNQYNAAQQQIQYYQPPVPAPEPSGLAKAAAFGLSAVAGYKLMAGNNREREARSLASDIAMHAQRASRAKPGSFEHTYNSSKVIELQAKLQALQVR